MSASYPLVRNLSAFSTRLRRVEQAFAARVLAELRQQLPDEILHLPIVYLARGPPPAGPGASPPDALYADRTNLASARRAAELWTRRADGQPTRLRRRVEAGARRLLARRPRAGRQSNGRSRKRHRGRAEGGRARAEPARRPFLDRRQHGRARRIVRRPRRTQVPQADQGTSSRPFCESTPPSSRARPIARSGAGMPRCRDSSAATTSWRKQHLRASLTYNPHSTASHYLSRGALDRRRTQGRGAQRTSEGPRRAARAGVGAGECGLQGEGKRHAAKAGGWWLEAGGSSVEIRTLSVKATSTTCPQTISAF